MKTKILFIALLTLTLLIGQAHAQIVINNEGITGTDDIHAEGNIYVFTEALANTTIIVQLDNVTLDGRGYIHTNVTLKLVNSTLTVTNMTITNSTTAVDIKGGNITLTANNFAGNHQGVTVTNILADTLVQTIVNGKNNNIYNTIDLYVRFLKLTNMPETDVDFTGNYWGHNTENLTVYPINSDYNDTAALLEAYGEPPIVVPEFPVALPTIFVAVTVIALLAKKRLEVKR